MIWKYKTHKIIYVIHLNIEWVENLFITVFGCNFIVRIEKYDRLFSYSRKKNWLIKNIRLNNFKYFHVL